MASLEGGVHSVFISYARSTAESARSIAEGLRTRGFDVWRDDQLPPHRVYADVIREQLAAASAVVVMWSADAVQSHWVRSEADHGRLDGKLVQLSLDGTAPPMPFDQIQCLDLAGWTGDASHAAFSMLVDSIADLTGGRGDPAAPTALRAERKPTRPTICVLPFANMSGDVDQEYFSDGITEDIITDLSKVSSLSVVARNTAFTFKGKAVDLVRLCEQLRATHVLEGSVRKAGNRVRISAQLIDGAAGDHRWAERWDRSLDDIFALQDEISLAVVGAVKLKLLPDERRAITQRGTSNSDAYNLYLMARQQYANGNQGDPRRDESIIRLCTKAIELDPGYARAWALTALAQTSLHFRFGRAGGDGLGAAEEALRLDPKLAEPHAVKARHLHEQGRTTEAVAEAETAQRLDARSYEVNLGAGYVMFREGRFADAIRCYEAAAALMPTDYHSAGTLISCYRAIGDEAATIRAAQMTLTRAEAAIAQDQSNGAAIGFAVVALAVLREDQRVRDWIERALLLDPENMNMRYNFACAYCMFLQDTDSALALIGPVLSSTTAAWLNHIKIDPDLDSLRGDPRFQAMIASAEAIARADA